MFQKIKNTIKSHAFDLLAFTFFCVVTLIIARANFTPNTWLTGWDNLHPEFNFSLNISRSLSSVWQEYQGLGLLGGMAHAADLPRQVILLVLSAVLPDFLLRYTWTFLLLLFGSFGAYKLAGFLVEKSYSKTKKVAVLSGITTGVFYVFNLATVQNFYTPYESFVHFWGMLPWLVFVGLKYLQEGTKNNLIKVVMIGLLSTAAFYVQTLFLVYLFILGIFSLEYIIKKPKVGIKRVVLLISTILIVNAFWLVPAVYFTVSGVSVVENSKINQIATPETKAMNMGASTIANTALLKGFWFDYIDISNEGDYGYLYEPWRQHLENTGVKTIGYVLFVLSLVGLVAALFVKGKAFRFSPFIIGVATIAILLWGYSLFGNLPIIGQAFRSVYTKWSSAAGLSLSIGAGLFIGLFLARFSKLLALLGVAVIIVLSVIFTRPILSGDLISTSVKVSIPDSYFSLFNFLETQPKDARIAHFPINTFWGWSVYSWGYRGSGFLWYGISQPILDRAFDVWSGDNETFYSQASHALYSASSEDFTNTLEKFDVSYVLIDQNIIAPKGQEHLLAFEKTKEYLISAGAKIVWSQNNIYLYKLANVSGNFISTPVNYSKVLADTKFSRTDSIYSTENATISAPNLGGSSSYPFAQVGMENASNITVLKDEVVVESNLQSSSLVQEIVIPEVSKNTSFSVHATISYNQNLVKISLNAPYKVMLDGENKLDGHLTDLYVRTEKDYARLLVDIGGEIIEVNQNQDTKAIIAFSPYEKIQIKLFDATSPRIVTTPDFSADKFQKCWERPNEIPFVEGQQVGDITKITTQDAVGCASFRLGSFNNNLSYAKVSLPYKSDENSRPDFCVIAEGEDKCIHDEVFYHSKASANWSEVMREMNLENNKTYWIVVSARPSDTPKQEWSIDYKSPRVEIYPQVAQVEFFAENWASFFTEKTISLKGESKLEVAFTSNTQSIDFTDNNNFNCDLFKRGNVQKEIKDGNVTYRADGFGAICDNTVLSGLKNSTDYVLNFKGTSKDDRGAKFYLYNKANQRNDLEALFPARDFDETYTILTSASLPAEDYILNLETRSFSDQSVENTFNDISISNIALSWLGGLKIVPLSGMTGYKSEVEVKNYQHIGTYYYSLSTNSSSDNGLISLSQGYNQAWIAYKGMPFIGKKLTHVQVNSWANGWLVPAGESQIYILYLPQYAQFGAVSVLVLPLIVFAVSRLKKFKKRDGYVIIHNL